MVTFLTIGIQTLQHQWKKYLERKETMLKNKPHLIAFYQSILVSFWTFYSILVYIRRIFNKAISKFKKKFLLEYFP